MKKHMIKNFKTIVVALSLLIIGLTVAAPALAVDLAGRKACISMPDGTVTDLLPAQTAANCPAGNIQIWRLVDPANDSPKKAPGQLILTATAGDTLTINLTNELGIPVSLVIPGQVMSPNNGPVWFADIADPYGSATAVGSRPAPTNAADPNDPAYKYRVRSFSHETAGYAGGVAGANTYVWPNLKAGTYLIQSGTHPSLQMPMGLYAVLVVNAAPGEPYTGITVANDVPLVFSEIDPYIHNAVNDITKSFPSANTYDPKYFLINGKPFPGNNPIPIGATGSTTLLRFANAGIYTYVPLLQGQSMQVIAEDGNLKAANLQFNRYSVDLHAGKTFDALLTNPAAPGYIPIYDRRLYMSNSAQAPGGMLAYLELSDGAQNQLTVTTTGGTGKGRVVAESMPGGINCDSSIVPPAPGATDCTQLYNAGTELKLVAYPNPGSSLNTWTGCITVTAANECLVTMDAAITVAATFKAVNAPQLITPATNSQIPAGSTYVITWAAPANAKKFTLKYSLDGGVTWVLIGKNLTGNSTPWIVPTPRKSKQALVRLTAFNNADVNIGADTNTVKIQTLTIVSPAGGESWTSGVNNLHDIVWQSFATPGLVKSIVIQYSKNNGTTWLNIPTGTLDNSSGVYDDGGTFHWQIEPQVTGNKPNSRVRILLKDAAGKNISVVVSNKFTITP